MEEQTRVSKPRSGQHCHLRPFPRFPRFPRKPLSPVPEPAAISLLLNLSIPPSNLPTPIANPRPLSSFLPSIPFFLPASSPTPARALFLFSLVIFLPSYPRLIPVAACASACAFSSLFALAWTSPVRIFAGWRLPWILRQEGNTRRALEGGRIQHRACRRDERQRSRLRKGGVS